VAGGKRTETILYPVQVLDEQVAAPRHRPQAFLHLLQGPGIMDVTLGGTAYLALVAVVCSLHRVSPDREGRQTAAAENPHRQDRAFSHPNLKTRK
jgi:hypothetical protein